MEGLDVPDEDYVGKFRGEPSLQNIGVRVGASEGSPPSQVGEELNKFEARLTATIEYLDAEVPEGELPDRDTLDAVLDVCGWAHAEWVRIHPFANGNGRTARLWANATRFVAADRSAG